MSQVVLMPWLHAGWVVQRPHEGREAKPPGELGEAKAIEPGAEWVNDEKFRWMRGELEIPEEIEGKRTAGEVVGMRLSCGDGGEVWVGGELRVRYDNDHPALVVLTERAEPGKRVRVDVQVYGKVQGGDRFGEAGLVII